MSGSNFLESVTNNITVVGPLETDNPVVEAGLTVGFTALCIGAAYGIAKLCENSKVEIKADTVEVNAGGSSAKFTKTKP